MADVVNPVDVETAIREAVNTISEAVGVVSARLTVWKDAQRIYDLDYATAYLNAPGPAHAKRYEAEIATTDQRHAMDVAEVAYKYADRRAKAAEEALSAWQSILRSVNGMYSAAGHMGSGG
jgi:hypothetical protein